MSPQRPEQVNSKTHIFGPVALALWASAWPAWAAPDFTLEIPGKAEETAQESAEAGSFRLATGPFSNGSLPTLQTEGTVQQRAWRVAMARPSTLELMQSLRKQLAAAGFDILFDCETEACGGFDFRFEVNVLAEPEMHIDLGDFRYLSAMRSSAGKAEYLSLMISRSQKDGFVQLTHVGGAAIAVSASKLAPAPIPVAAINTAVAPEAGIAARLDAGLPVVLEDLDFKSGSGSVTEADYASLRDLAAWLKADPARTITLVGHTDGSGGLAGNIALSKQRAASVQAALVKRFGLGSGQVSSDGVGPLAPRASDTTPEGRSKNRRVEAIVTSTP